MALGGDSLSLVGMTWRNLYRQPLRTSLTVVGVSVGVIAIVALGTLVRGLWSATDAALHASGADLVVYQKGVSVDLLSRLDEAEARTALGAIPDVAELSAGVVHLTPVGGRRFVFVLGMYVHEFGLRAALLREGRMIAADDEVLVGALLQRGLDLAVGDEIELEGDAFKIAGVFTSEVVFFDGAVIMTTPALQGLTGLEGQVGFIQVRVRAGADPSAVVAQIERDNPSMVAVDTVVDYHKVDLGLEIADNVVLVISFAATMIGAIIVTNTMWLSVYERTREIGVLRAVGWSSRQVMGMIIIESAGIALIACVVGSVLGVVLAKIAASLPVAGQFASPELAAPTLLLALAVALILGIVGGAMPAWRAARISPAEALRYE